MQRGEVAVSREVAREAAYVRIIRQGLVLRGVGLFQPGRVDDLQRPTVHALAIIGDVPAPEHLQRPLVSQRIAAADPAGRRGDRDGRGGVVLPARDRVSLGQGAEELPLAPARRDPQLLAVLDQLHRLRRTPQDQPVRLLDEPLDRLGPGASRSTPGSSSTSSARSVPRRRPGAGRGGASSCSSSRRPCWEAASRT